MPAPRTTTTTARQVRRALSRGRARGCEAGMTTAEYAVGTVAACGFGGVLYKLLTSQPVQELLTGIIRRALTISF